MGGFGSGTGFRWGSKQTVEAALSLDLCKLIKQGFFVVGQHVSGSIKWHWVSTGKESGNISYVANLLNVDDAWLRLVYTHNGTPQDYKIHLTTTVPCFGGVRWWFLCPVTGERVGTLHSSGRQPVFASRQASGLVYQSQREGRPQRLLDKSFKIQRKLGCEGGYQSFGYQSFGYQKPKGMHWKTYSRLVNEMELLQNAGYGMMSRKLAGLRR
jgi:hypothetical protein